MYTAKKIFPILLFVFICLSTIGQVTADLKYTLNHKANSNSVEIVIEFSPKPASEVILIIPRSGPGTYEMTNYLAFVDNVRGFGSSNTVVNGHVGDGSFFVFESQAILNKVSYEVNIKTMELGLLSGSASSKLRDNYLGMLGYSVFGIIEELEELPINLNINTQSDWPVFSTLSPNADRKLGSDNYRVENFGLLADAQYFLGPDLQIYQVPETQIPLFVAVYSEVEIDIKEIGRRSKLALTGLIDFFGFVPMPHYTVCYEFLKPLSVRHDYGFSMEHLNSMTASMDTSRAIKDYDANARIGGIVHHIGHSWVPLRSYGTGYRPFEWQTAPLIETIWLNEGFTWYISFYYVLNFKNIMNRFNRTINTAPTFIQEKSLRELSLLGSSQYALDFRIGQNLFSRGALLAHDLDIFIQKETQGKKTFKDVMLGLLQWTDKNKRAFTYDEIAPIISKAVGVDITSVWNQWQDPQPR